MKFDELHFRGPIVEIRDLKNNLTLYSIDAKVVRKSNETHIFARDSNADGSETGNLSKSAAEKVQALLDSSWIQCSGCELCRKSASTHQKAALYPPLILLPTGSDLSVEEATTLLSLHSGYTHVAVNAPIQVGDPVRRPKITPLVGSFGEFDPCSQPSAESFQGAFWCECTQNGIYQTWAPMYTMFSRGNITEKKRVLDTFAAQAPIKGTTVVDLYAGIGYFTLSYAKRHARIIYCWEINWWSVQGLLRAAQRNKFNARAIHENETYVPEPNDCIVIFVEDNQRALYRLQTLNLTRLSHINMGLLPHCRDAFPVASTLAERSSQEPVVHVHENVRAVEIEKWKTEIAQTFGNCLHVEKIKSYSPGVVHVCGDFTRRSGRELS